MHKIGGCLISLFLVSGISVTAAAGDQWRNHSGYIAAYPSPYNDLAEPVSSLENALYHSFLQNPTLRAERAELRAVQEEYPQAFSNFLPSLTVGSAFDANNIRGDEIDEDSDGAATKEFSFTVSQPVFRGGQTFSELSEAKNNIQAARAALLAEEQDIFLDVVRVYMNIIRDRKALKLQEENQKILETRLNNSRRLFQAGEFTKTDVSQSEARLSGARSDRIDAEVDLNATIEQFRNLVGARPAETMRFPTQDIGIPHNFEVVQNTALNNNPEIVEAHFEYLAAKAAADSEYRAFLPQIAMSASYTNQIDPGPGQNKHRRESAVGVSMSVPFFQGGGQRSEVREAKLQANQAKLEMKQVVQDVMEELADTWQAYKSASRKIEFRRIQVASARSARDSVEKEVKAGERVFVDLLDADQDLLDAELNLTLAERDLTLQTYTLKAVMGQLNSEYYDFNRDGKVYTPDQNMKRLKSFDGFLSMDPYEDLDDYVADNNAPAPAVYRKSNVQPPVHTEPERTPYKTINSGLRYNEKTLHNVPVKNVPVKKVKSAPLSDQHRNASNEMDTGGKQALIYKDENMLAPFRENDTQSFSPPAPDGKPFSRSPGPSQSPMDKLPKSNGPVIYKEVENRVPWHTFNSIQPASGYQGGFDRAVFNPRVNKGKPFFIQMGSFSDYYNAERFSRQLGKFGTAHIFSGKAATGKVYRVHIGPLNDRDSADDMINTLYENGYTDVFVKRIN